MLMRASFPKIMTKPQKKKKKKYGQNRTKARKKTT